MSGPQSVACSAALHQGEHDNGGVPTTLPAALSLFFTHPSTVLALAIILGLAVLRCTCGAPVGLMEVTVVVAASMAWVAQEWAIHRYLLHSPFQWLGKSIHEAHHGQPYHHVSIDDPPTVAGFMTLAGAVAWLLLQGNTALVCAACISYFTTGLLSYQLVHYLVHTRWVPEGRYMRAIRQHHMRHHMRNHDYWFAFSAPWMDALFGTLPAHPKDVPLNVIPRMQLDTSLATSGAAGQQHAAPSPASTGLGQHEHTPQEQASLSAGAAEAKHVHTVCTRC